MEVGSFCGGSIVGALYGAVIVYILWRMEKNRIKIAGADRPYDKFPDSAHPNLTASGVIRTSRQARFTQAVLALFLIAFAVSLPMVIYLLLS